jgi:MYXO-CTERM domain-containing protein
MHKLTLAVFSLLAGRAAAAVPEGFSDAAFATIPNDPQVTSMAWAPDGSNRLFVTGKLGQIWIVKDGALLPQLFYRFQPRVGTAGELVTSSECGLLGLAFDPDFATNRYVYVFATLRVPPDDHIEQQIIRLTADGDAGTGRVAIVTGLASRGANHDGGALAFGPDGLLYWAVGDTGNLTGVGADLASSAGKIGRVVAAPAAPPPPGPFNDGDGPNYDYTFARGFRNPYTMTFHPVTGRLWVNVVGTAWEQVFVVEEADHAGYPMENVEPGAGGYTTMSPVIAYPTHDDAEQAIASARRAAGVATYTTATAHRVRRGSEIDVAGVGDASFNGRFVVADVPSPTALTVAQPGGDDAESDGGALQIVDRGSVILGGTFYDATLFPAEHRLAFFFGDFASGQLVRAVTDGPRAVSETRTFGTSFGNHIDAATGPDGALYVVRHGGAIRRIAYDRQDLGIVVSPQHLRLSEGGQGVVGVRLTRAPGQSVTVSFQRAGDADVAVATGAMTFDDATWAAPQYARITSASDLDRDEDVAAIEVSSGAMAETVTVRVTDLVAQEPAPDAGVPDAAISDAAPPPPDAPAAQADARPAPDARAPGGDEDGGCDCRAGGGGGAAGWALAALVLLPWLRRRRRA